jgi:hypothetical protein
MERWNPLKGEMKRMLLRQLTDVRIRRLTEKDDNVMRNEAGMSFVLLKIT